MDEVEGSENSLHTSGAISNLLITNSKPHCQPTTNGNTVELLVLLSVIPTVILTELRL